MVDGQKMTRHKKRRHDEVHHVGQVCRLAFLNLMTCAFLHLMMCGGYVAMRALQ